MSESIEKENKANMRKMENNAGKIDEIINSLLMNVKENISNVSVFKRMKSLLVTLENMIVEYNSKNSKISQ